MKEAENFRVRDLVKKIESHPHREALQADLQQNNDYNPFSNNSKAMNRELGNVELFEICETIPKVQRSQCLLHWNQGVIYCTCGHLLVESESSPKFYKLRLDALSIPHYVIKKGRHHGGTVKLKHRNSTISPSTRGRDVAKELTAKKNIMKEFTIVFFETKYIVIRNSKIGWTEQKCIEMDKLAQQDHSYRLSREEFERYQGQCYLHRCDFDQTSEQQSNQGPSPPRIRRRTCRTHSFSTIPKMSPFFLK